MDLINIIFYYLARLPLFKIWKFLDKNNLNESHDVNSLPQIDLVICVIEKDLPILQISLAGVRKNCLNPIKDIFIVAPCNSQIVEFCEVNELTFVDELKVYSKEKINATQFIYNGVDRSGWIYQQVLKLSFNYGTCEDYLVIDADHVLNNPHLFVNAQGIPVFYMSEEFNISYYITNYRLLKLKPHLFSFISHKCIFNKSVIDEFSKEIMLDDHGTDWVLDLLSYVSFDSSGSPFSEYEFYCSYFLKKHICILKPWNNLNISRSDIDQVNFLKRGNYDTYTFPSYMH